MWLYLDDKRDIPNGFVGARNYEEAVTYLETGKVKLISLDHDLGCDDDGNILKSGYDLVKWICENGINIDKIYIHTDNPVGRADMYETLKSCKKHGIIDYKNLYHYPLVPNKYSNVGEE